MKHALAAACLVVAPLRCLAADVTLEVDGLDAERLQGSTLMVAVFTDASGWLRQPQAGHRFELTPSVAAAGRFRVTLKNLPAGPLALSLFQDANGNGRLDMSALGIPTERYGFSNNASGRFGPPRFEQALLTPVDGQVLKVSMN